MTQESSEQTSLVTVGWLAVGTFAIGAEAFMIGPLLPRVAADLAVSIGTAGTLVTAFTLAYAFGSPVLTTLAGTVDRRTLLIAAMASFAAANLLAWASRGFWDLMAVRVLMAFSAGLYTPNAGAYAGTLVAPDQRGRALAIVNAGLTTAIVLGLPLGFLIGDRFGWRATFLSVALLGMVAAAGLVFGLKRKAGSAVPTVSLRDRLAVAQQPVILLALIQTAIWATGTYGVWTYIAPYLAAVVDLEGSYISGVVFVWGFAGAIGLFAGGYLNDRLGSKAAITSALSLLTFSFLILSVSAALLSPAQALAPVTIAVFLWGFSAWGFFPPQVARLIGLGGAASAPIVLSLNASAMYVGFSAGSAFGGVVLAHLSMFHLTMAGASFELTALLLAFVTVREPAAEFCAEPAE